MAGDVVLTYRHIGHLLGVEDVAGDVVLTYRHIGHLLGVEDVAGDVVLTYRHIGHLLGVEVGAGEVVLTFFIFFFIVYSLLNIHRDLPVLFCIFFGLLGHILCRGLPNALFFFVCCSLDSNPDNGNANMVYQRLNVVGHPDPQTYRHKGHLLGVEDVAGDVVLTYRHIGHLLGVEDVAGEVVGVAVLGPHHHVR